jgi:outer membrane receptor protein involved in Fe transport
MQIFAAEQDTVSVEAAPQATSPWTEQSASGTRSKSRVSKRIYLAVALLFLFPPLSAFAQYEDGSLIGTIHDASGAAIANAAIAVTNLGTGNVIAVNANGSGDYEVTSLRVGLYNIEATAPGFAPAEAKNITVSVGGRERIDLTLKVGSAAATTVEVSDVSLQIETETSERGQSVSEYQTESLPLVSRNYSDLLALVTGSRQAPTAATTTAVTSLVRAGAYNVNGLRSMFNNYLLDGMDNNAYGESNQGFDNQIIQPTPDAISQFQVVTNNESAEYGRSAGATINVASKSGTNRFHTTLYEFIRNTDLNGFGYYHAVSGVHVFPKPGFNRNQFGATFGGPIVKNKLFYFIDYEGFRQTLTPTTVFTVPTDNEIGVGTSTGTPQLAIDVTNPLTGLYYKANTPIPAAAINPTSLKILGFFAKLPSYCLTPAGSTLIATSGSAIGVASNDCATNAPFTDNADKGDMRIDYQQSEKSSWFLKISDRKETGINFPTEPEPLDSQANGNGRIKILDQQVALGYTRLMGSNKVLDARLALSGTQAGKYSLAIGNSAITIPGLPSVAADPTVAGGLPTITFSTGYSSVGRQNTNPQWQNPSLLDPKVNFSWIKGKHSFKFGYEYEHIWMEVQDSNPLFGAFAYSGHYSLCPASAGSACVNTSASTENYWADFLFGTTSQYQLATFFKAHLLQTMDSWYAQDDWKVDPKLTLNLGLRWEYGSPYSDADNHLSNFNPSTVSLLTLTPGYSGTGPGSIATYNGSGVYGKTLVNPSLGDYAPRVGFAYALTPTVAIRGGYGTSFVHYTRAGSGDILPINAPNALFITVNQTSPASTPHCPANAVSTSCYVTMDEGFPNGLATASNFYPGTDNITYIPQNTKDAYAESYFLSVQKSLAKNTLLDFAYVGNHGVKLQGFVNANQENPAAGLTTVPGASGFARPYPTWGTQLSATQFQNGDITEALNGFYSHYNALQVRYEQRFVDGLTLLNSFTYEHSLDNASEALSGITPSPQNVFNLRGDYGQSDNNLPVADILSLVYDVPVGHGRQVLGSINPVADAIIGGWQISGVNTMQAGTPFTLDYGPSSANQVSPQILPSSATYRGAILYRPNYLPGNPVVDCNSGHTCIAHQASSGAINYTNWNAFTLPFTYTTGSSLLAGGAIASPFGNAPRNIGRTPKYYETDLDLNKRFNTPIESLKIEFRAEAYNVFNHTNLYLPGGTSGSALSGANATTGVPTAGGTITGTLEPRILQLALKVIY